MARIVSLGEVEVTKLHNYHWTVSLTPEGHAQVSEVYVVTDDEHKAVPEGRKVKALKFTTAQQKTLDNLFTKAMKQAATDEEVELDVELPEES